MNPLRRLRVVPERDTPSDENGLLAAVGRGDEDAFGRFYDLTAARLHGIVLKVVRNPALAEEITQEVYLEIWRLAPRFDPSRGSAIGWSATIAHRRAVDRVRAEQARTDREERDRHSPSAPFDSVVEQVLDRIDRSAVGEALRGLSEQQRTAVTLAYYGGHTYRQVAVLLDIPEGTAKTRIRDGLIKLRDQFGVAP
ncbi:MAG: ECF RNA polymerase sigma factor SigK [Actinomycetota bacterium]